MSEATEALVDWMALWDRVCDAADPDDREMPPPWSEVKKVLPPDADPDSFTDADVFRDYMHATLVYLVRDVVRELRPLPSR